MADTTNRNHYTPLNQVQQLVDVDYSNFRLDQFLSSIAAVVSQEGELIENSSVNLRTRIKATSQLGMHHLTTVQAESIEKATASPHQYLKISDLLFFLLQVKDWALPKIPSDTNSKAGKKALQILGQYKFYPATDRGFFNFVSQLTTVQTVELAGQNRLSIDEKGLYEPKVYQHIVSLINGLKFANQFLSERALIKTPEVSETESAKEGLPSATSTGVGQPTTPQISRDQEVEAEAGAEPAEPSSPTPDQQPNQPTLSSEPPLAQRKAVAYETAWVYNRLVFELFTSQGIDPASLDQNLLNQLYELTSNEIWKNDALELASMFASPSARLKILQAVKERVLANNTVLTGVFQEYQRKAKPHTPTAEWIEKRVFSQGVTTTETGKEKLKSSESVLGESLSKIITSTGGESQKAEFNIEFSADIQTAINQAEFMLRTYGVEKSNLTPEEFKQRKARALAIIEKMSPSQLQLIFFPQIGGASSTISRQQFLQISDRLKEVLINYLQLRAAELAMTSQSWQNIEGLLPDEEVAAVTDEEKQNPTALPKTLSKWSAIIPAGRGESIQDDEIQSKRSQSLEKHRAQTAQYIAQYGRAWKFLPVEAKIEAYKLAGLEKDLPDGLDKLPQKDLEKLDLEFKDQIFYLTNLEEVLQQAKIAKKNLRLPDGSDEALSQYDLREQLLEKERAQRVKDYLAQVSEERRQAMLEQAKLNLEAELAEQAALLQAQQAARREAAIISAQEEAYFNLRQNLLSLQQAAIAEAALEDLSIQDLIQADMAVEAAGFQSSSLRQRLRSFGGGSPAQRQINMAKKAAQRKMAALSEDMLVKLVAKAGWQGWAAAQLIKHREKIKKYGLAALAGGAIGTIAMILKFGRAALAGAIGGGITGGVAGAYLGAQIGGSIGAALAPFTGGLSIPIGAGIGGVIGGVVGAVGGAITGAGIMVAITQNSGGGGGAITTSVTGAPSSPLISSTAPTTIASPTSFNATNMPPRIPASTPALPRYPSQLPSTFIQSPISSTPTGVTALGTTALASALGGSALMVPAIAMTLMVITSVSTLWIIFSSFLVPLPVGNPTTKNRAESRYLTISKVASPKKIANNHGSTQVTYSITIKPKSGYTIKLTQPPKDVIEFLPDSASKPILNPPTSPINEAGGSISDTISGFTSTQYEIEISGGKDVMVRNNLALTFDVYKKGEESAEPIATNQTIETNAFVAIGKPKVNCWPVSGTISQGRNGTYSHTNVDAYDIKAPFGTTVYAPFDGVLKFGGKVLKETYGENPAILEINYQQKTKTYPIKLIFGHLSKIYQAGSLPRPVQMGEPIGEIGNDGFSQFPHLHYEVRPYRGVISIKDLVPPKNSDPSSEWDYPDKVYTCF